MARYPQAVSFTTDDPLMLIRQVRHVLRGHGMDIGLLLVHPRAMAEIANEADAIRDLRLDFEQKDENEGTIFNVPFKQTVDI